MAVIVEEDQINTLVSSPEHLFDTLMIEGARGRGGGGRLCWLNDHSVSQAAPLTNYFINIFETGLNHLI